MSEGDEMARDWQALTKMTGNRDIVIERVGIKNSDIHIDGSFELPPMAQLSMEDQVFAATFIKTHGSIKEMEKLFGVSYPTVKNRLNRIAAQLDFVNVDVRISKPGHEILEKLDRGEISVDQAMEELS